MTEAGWLRGVKGSTHPTTNERRSARGWLLLAAVCLSAGCAHERAAVLAARESGRRGPAEVADEPTQRPASAARLRAAQTEPVALRAYEVRESAFSDFGMSVTTNFEVQWGGKIEWMTVNAVAGGTSADLAGLAPGDRIMAIDGQLVVGMERDAMLGLFFQRKKGERSRLLVLGRRQAMPGFVNLIANRP